MRFAGTNGDRHRGASGLGRSIVMRLVDEGVSVTVADIESAGAERLADDLAGRGTSDGAPRRRERRGRRCRHGEQDCRRLRWIARAVQHAAALGRELASRDQDLLVLDIGSWDRTMAVNLRGVMLGCKHAVPVMIAAGGGSIVNTASTGAFQGTRIRAAYGASKAGIVSLTPYVAVMYGRGAVRCKAIAPGYMANPGHGPLRAAAARSRHSGRRRGGSGVSGLGRRPCGDRAVVRRRLGRLAHKPEDSVRMALHDCVREQ